MNKVEHPLLLAIESSCDDTSVAIISGQNILINSTYSQQIHQDYGGVVPEVASRAHQEKLPILLQSCLDAVDLKLSKIDAVAVTKGPGLIGSLMVGHSFAKSLAYGLNIPLIEVHHMRAHILAHLIDDPKPPFPFLCLTVSGGHTQIVKVSSPYDMEILGSTIDDAAGEAFDKSGKLLGLPYPAGPEIDKLSQKGTNKFTFNKPRIEGLDFSFSGLKTSILYFLQSRIKEEPTFIQDNIEDLCASIQESIIDILIEKLEHASNMTGIKDLAIAGGVSANSGLRSALNDLAIRLKGKSYIPDFHYCTDNAGMIAIAGYFQYLMADFAEITASADARLPFG
jgi:N6-L-threonylcarbamoyladenine synthase